MEAVGGGSGVLVSNNGFFTTKHNSITFETILIGLYKYPKDTERHQKTQLQATKRR